MIIRLASYLAIGLGTLLLALAWILMNGSVL
jgi:hypothetical protein